MRKLPVRMHLNHGAYYYKYRNVWTYLSRDYGDALRLYAGLIAPRTGGMPALLDRYLAKATVTLAPSTISAYQICVNRLKTAFVEFNPEQIEPQHVYQFFTENSIAHFMQNHYRSVLIGAMKIAVKEGLVSRNLMKELESNPANRRKRYLSDQEWMSIYNVANPMFKAIMDVSHVTGQRISDVAKIKISDLTEEGIKVIQKKTGHPQIIAWNPDLIDAVKRARQVNNVVKGMYLFSTRKGTQFTYSTLRTYWDRYCKYAKVENATMHDMRKKSGTDAKKAGLDSKGLLGHESDSAHKIYLLDVEVPVVVGNKKVSLK